jgi:nucleoside-triphosphatase THEP1
MNNLSDKWTKASVVGTIWAASEIVFGSFLHNLRVPFCGNILTAIGIIILISIAYLWKENGIFWRAGLICALMKTMSPSAVIFGPMIAIFTEALLLEITVFVFGRNYAGFILGSVLAMSWNLVQKILSYILFYGFDIVKVYTGLVKIAEKQIGYHFDLLWTPILLLLILYALFGVISAILGIKTGKAILKKSVSESFSEAEKINVIKPKQSEIEHSLIWLAANILMMLGGLIILKLTDWFIWIPYVAIIATIWIFRYHRALKKISNPKFWIIFVLITLLTVFVFSQFDKTENSLIKGLIAGIQMNFRAVLMILGFSVLAVELFNPAVRKFFGRTSFKQLPVALELSFESLPMFISAIPDFKTVVKSPVNIFSAVIIKAQKRLEELNRLQTEENTIFIVSGKKGEGKTSFIKDLIVYFKEKKISVGGILSEKQLQNDECLGYEIVDIENEEKVQFLLIGDIPNCNKIMKFSIINEGLEFGNKTLQEAFSTKDIIIIDEVGLLELQDGGWSQILLKVNESRNKIFVITARDIFVAELIAKYNWKQAQIVQIDKVRSEDFVKQF